MPGTWTGWSFHECRSVPRLSFTVSNDRSTEADLLRCGYDLGYFDKADITRWADRQIEACDSPPTELLDLSMIRDTHPIDVMNLLRTFGSPDSSTTIQTQIGFIGLLLAEGKISTQRAIRGLFALVHQPGITHEQASQIYHLDDGYDLAVAGTYGTIGGIERDLRQFVFAYASRLAEQYPQWIRFTKYE